MPIRVSVEGSRTIKQASEASREDWYSGDEGFRGIGVRPEMVRK